MDFHIYAGTVRGGFAYSECKKNKKVSYELDVLDGEITALEWGKSNDEIILGDKNGNVRIYNTGLSKYVLDISKEMIEGTDSVVGLGLLDENIIIGRKNGVVNSFNSEKKSNTQLLKLNLNEDATVNTMCYHPARKVIAMGGDKNDLKLWDIINEKEIFKAKSLGKDELELPIPTSIRGITFMDDDHLIACATKEGMVLLYDERTQRRPVKKLREPKACFTSIASYQNRQCLVGTSKGYLQLIDMAAAKCIKTFQPFAGAVTSIVCDKNEPYVISTSLDKHLRIHNINTKELVHKEYMKIALTKVLVRPIVKEEPKEEKKSEVIDKEYEGMFDEMETINDEDDSADEEEPQDIPKVTTKRKVIKNKKIKGVKKRKSA